MTPDQIRVGQVLQGKGTDACFTREVLSINPKRREAVTLVYRHGKLVGEALPMSLMALARWAEREVAVRP
jgi:hypothetical protein